MLGYNFFKYLLISNFLIFVLLLGDCNAMFEEIEVTPNYSGGFYIGDLTFAQYLILCLIFLKLVVLYSEGIIPIEIYFGDMPGILGSAGLFGRSLKFQNDATKSGVNKIDLTTFAITCPMQYLCDLDFWAQRPHESFIEETIASWFRNSKSTFTDPKLATYAGTGTCRESFPCPFDVQEAVGLHIPGSRNVKKSKQKSRDVDLQMELF